MYLLSTVVHQVQDIQTSLKVNPELFFLLYCFQEYGGKPCNNLLPVCWKYEPHFQAMLTTVMLLCIKCKCPCYATVRRTKLHRCRSDHQYTYTCLFGTLS